MEVPQNIDCFLQRMRLEIQSFWNGQRCLTNSSELNLHRGCQSQPSPVLYLFHCVHIQKSRSRNPPRFPGCISGLWPAEWAAPPGEYQFVNDVFRVGERSISGQSPGGHDCGNGGLSTFLEDDCSTDVPSCRRRARG